MTDIWLTHSKITQEAEAKFSELDKAQQSVIDAARAKSKKKTHKKTISASVVFNPGVVKINEFGERILEAARSQPDRVWTTLELSEETGIARGCVGDSLRTLVNRNKMLRTGVPKRFNQGGGGYTYKYLKVEVGDD